MTTEYRVIQQGELTDDDGWQTQLAGDGWEFAQNGPCPDCKGKWVWWEAGFVPGTRACATEHGGCGSLFRIFRHDGHWYVGRERFYG